MAILNYIYVFWVALVFMLTLIVAFLLLMPGFLLPSRAGNRYSNFILRWWATIWSTLIMMPVRSKGKNPAHAKETMVIVTNHNSYLDTTTSYINVSHLFKTLAKKELTKIPLMGQIFLTSGIMVDRSSAKSRGESYQRMVNAVKSGTSILIFPEGTQNRTDQPLQPFFDGAFRLAVECQVPILPIVTLNTRWLMPQANVAKMRPGTIRQIFLDPIPTKGMGQDDIESLKEKVFQLTEEVIRREAPKWS